MEDRCLTNESLANFIIEQLIKLGVVNFCIGSGSRSAPIAKALQNNVSANTYFSYEERHLGFYALGVAKTCREPVVIITTSGSAVGNLYPAIMEAYHSHTPLIVLSTDRPFENRDRGLNQTCQQQDLFQSYTVYNSHITSAPHSFSKKSLNSFLAQGVNKGRRCCLPIHLNVEFSEPLFSLEKVKQEQEISIPKYHEVSSLLSKESINYLVDIFESYTKGIIVVGENPKPSNVIEIIRLAELLQYPIIADPLSGLREVGSCGVVISHYNQIIHHGRSCKDLNPELILFLGGKFVSKNILQWTQGLKNAHQIMVNNSSHHRDPTLHINDHIDMEVSCFCALMRKKARKNLCGEFSARWKELSLLMEEEVEVFFEDKEKLYEPCSIISLLSIVEESAHHLFFGNSLSIRYADNFFFPKKATKKIFANRGVSGIDGNISTAIGIANTLKEPLICIIGDQTFFYDLSALKIISQDKIPLILVVVNNEGGAIFDFLPYSGDKTLMKNYISPKNSLPIGELAKSFGLSFWKTSDTSDYKKMIAHLLAEGTGGVIEIVSSREDNLYIHKKLDQCLGNKIKKHRQKEHTSFFSIPKKRKNFYVSTDF